MSAPLFGPTEEDGGQTENRHLMKSAIFCLLAAISTVTTAAQDSVLPPSVKAVWEVGKAHREASPSRERVCLNGLWRWQPAQPSATPTQLAPTSGWGYFKVPGSWPGITDYMQKDCQTVFPHPDWKAANLAGTRSAWYQREIDIPASWNGRRIKITTEYLNSYATVLVDGKHAGEMRFPAGEVDISGLCKPGGRHLLTLLVEAMPLKAVRLSYTDTNSARQVPGSVNRRGICGDVWLIGEPRGPRISDVKVETSVLRKEITFDVEVTGLAPRKAYSLRAAVGPLAGKLVTLRAEGFGTEPRPSGRVRFSRPWNPKSLWDLHTPGNLLEARISLAAGTGKPIDTALPVRFGFRELRIVGRDFYLNGTRIFLSSVPLDNAQVGAAWASYAGAKESLLRLKSFGVNFVYTHNYDCEPGSHISFAEILRAADDVGMLVALSQPHFSAYDWKAADAERANGYAGLAEFYVRQAQNHPSVVAYAMSHNATSYDEAKNPDLMDGIYNQRDNWSANNVRQALKAEAIVKRLDPSRIVYHHSSGNLGAMFTENFYINFAPKQEMSDWFEHWATKGVKPLFLCEFAVPCTWDWTMYRGWYQGQREWGSANVPWDFSMAEWNAQFHGDRAFRITDQERANVRWEARQFREGRAGWHRWDYPHAVGSGIFDERLEVIGEYIEENWRAMRTWGVSAFGPWEHEIFWRLKAGVDQSRKSLAVDWDKLQRPGFSPDYLDRRYERMDLAYERSDWEPTAAAKALTRNNAPLLAYIGGKEGRFTEKSHLFSPGEQVEKQIVIVNNSRRTVTATCRWDVGSSGFASGKQEIKVPTGQIARVPIRFRLPALSPADVRPNIRATVRFDTGQTVVDTFPVSLIGPIEPTRTGTKIALFDPKGETRTLLHRLGFVFDSVDEYASLSAFDLLIIGKGALTATSNAPDPKSMRSGARVVVFEQSAEVLEKRLGFRVAEYGLRQAFARVSDHPIVRGFEEKAFRDWRGEATLLPPRLKYTLRPMYGPMVPWSGFDVPRTWRCGNRGNVASVLIEKPASGDFLPILEGGFSLQYSPLLLHRDGRSMTLFCQMDLSGRTEYDPAALHLAKNIVQFACDWKPQQMKRAVYAGDPAGRAQLERAGIRFESSQDARADSQTVAILGTGFPSDTAMRWKAAGAQIVGIGLTDSEAQSLTNGTVRLRREEHISCEFPQRPVPRLMDGIGPADLYNRDASLVEKVGEGADITIGGVLAMRTLDRFVLCQLVPWRLDTRKPNQKKSFRRSSYLLTRLLANLGVPITSPLHANLTQPASPGEKRWLAGLYLDIPDEWDDPYRFFPW